MRAQNLAQILGGSLASKSEYIKYFIPGLDGFAEKKKSLALFVEQMRAWVARNWIIPYLSQDAIERIS